jgi:hypothetical protein
MSDINDFAALYRNHTKATAEANLINKSVVFDALAAAGIASVLVVFDALAAAGIASVLVEFDGEGDSGQIEYICADDSAEIPQTFIEMQQVAWGTGKLDSVQTTLREAIEKLCYDFLDQEHGGWENNDGAYGEFTFDVAERTVNLDFNARFTDSTHFSQSF